MEFKQYLAKLFSIFLCRPMLPWLQPFKKMQSRDKKFKKMRMIFQHGRKAAKRHPLKLYSETEIKVKVLFLSCEFFASSIVMRTL
jgi:hypothetical protein